MGQWLRQLVAIEDQSFVPNTKLPLVLDPKDPMLSSGLCGSCIYPHSDRHRDNSKKVLEGADIITVKTESFLNVVEYIIQI